MRSLLLAILAVALLAAPAAFAHTPQDCVPLFHEAARQNQEVVEFGQLVMDTELEMLDSRIGSHRDRYRRYSSDLVEKHADILSQFLPRLTDFWLVMAKAVKCVDGQK